jgi:hypothetical protein
MAYRVVFHPYSLEPVTKGRKNDTKMGDHQRPKPRASRLKKFKTVFELIIERNAWGEL